MPDPRDAEARATAARAYDAAADHYDHSANAFWERYGGRTVERLRLEPGARVVDACCGSGASAIPAARAVGPSGRVVGVDAAENLLALARAKAQRLALANLELRRGDAFDSGLEPAAWDAAICVFGIFFAPDVAGAARALWRLVRPGGRLAVTTWGPRLFEPMNGAFWSAVRDARPELHKAFNPWDRICEPSALAEVLARAGVASPEIEAERGAHAVADAQAWWAIVMGSGYRGTVERLTPEERARVRAKCDAFLRREGVREVETSVVYAVARKPA